MSSEFSFFKRQNIKDFFAEKEAAPRKKWGQNFLTDRNIIDIICKHIENHPGFSEADELIEIGPGLGAITHILSRSGKKMSVLEIDPVLIENLKIQNYSVEILEGDALQTISSFREKKVFAAGNLPYSISSELMAAICRELPLCTGGIFMLQREFAERIAKEVSSLSIFLHSFGEWELLKIVSPGCFYPVPDATSALLKYTPYPEKILSPEETVSLEKILKSFFWGKRKTVSRILQDSPFLNESERKNLGELIDRENSDLIKFRPEDIDKKIYYTLAKKSEFLRMEA
ncbi:MAG TPA: 16S rRNA (adenine(1518)-N(6)/adenine(1519)-N(6))-dimethyltransferase RsmA [Leptospiraceae bacterium]|nr:16S rRNA (adenine(1518)-N(6)/adenine(1519)-N(6))-dimethyltransferase RsmA [Leptospiraceae bacterium]HMZ57424.1 16S rRNA (adenine(1518)-N(6)/adenine(1519)-N(6))-dimethyltransferase RsmA [Leptospiraceae bacterium]HNF14956.1 16S rRNA (adenine(1518)-N(6)/adenine(1519)-N(6))-dimethyltransferase RsmA [Leptospiraceae bacterium]HNF23822.1 16S rRNA (adenine(1518)-N(6)/adenine(1519)-N(6))-dimethyltransferase RsmA [Leptospiraceae bacterium]HNI95997.1 16S rRNA (adenine(1518)-N(6)/adenine(1519)-N(6))-dim